MRKLIITIFCIAPLSAQSIEPEPIITYGELLVKEQSADFGNDVVNVTVGYENGNPLLDVYNLSIAYNRNFYDYFEVGAVFRRYSSDKTALLNSVEQNFGLLGVDINSEVPKEAYYLTVGVLPLKGRLNFFGIKTLPYQWALILGVGERKTEIDKYLGYLWAIESRVLVTSSISLVVSYNQEAEAAFDERTTVNRNQFNVGLGISF